MHNTHHYVVDRGLLTKALRARGYSSFGELARKLNLHRNTIGNYLAGAPAIPAALEKILTELELEPAKAIVSPSPRKRQAAMSISILLDDLVRRWPDCAFVMFGSRARGTHKALSDYDIGVYRASGIDFSDYSRMLTIVSEWNETSLTTAQLTNLTRADNTFSSSIRSDLIFLGGSNGEWLNLLKFVGVSAYE